MVAEGKVVLAGPRQPKLLIRPIQNPTNSAVNVRKTVFAMESLLWGTVPILEEKDEKYNNKMLQKGKGFCEKRQRGGMKGGKAG